MRVYEQVVQYGQPVAMSDRFWLRLTGDEGAVRLAADLVANSVEFTFEPYPDGEYEFTVKADQKRNVLGIIGLIDPLALEG